MPVYLDYNATTPIAPEVAEAIRPCLGPLFGNPSSPHLYGIEARRAVDAARAQVADLVGCAPGQVVFTGGGTEANNMALKGVAYAADDRTRRRIITSAVEHPAILEPLEALGAEGFDVIVLPVDGHGLVDPDAVRRAVDGHTLLVSVMHANNEVGTIQPVAEIAAIAHEAGALMHTDAAQTPGKVSVHADDLGADLISLAGHKLYAPKGVGALVVRERVRLAKYMHGATHEGNRRAGTENLIGIIGLGAAAALVGRDLEGHSARLRAMRDRLQAGLLAADPDARVNGHPTRRLPNTLSIGFRDLDADDLLVEMSDRVAASAGAACHSNQVTISAVLQAMGVPLEYARGTLRFSVGRMTTADEIDEAVDAVAAALHALRA